MSSTLRKWMDSHGHVLGCRRFGELPEADPGGSYLDLFCDCHTWSEPKVLANGTDVAWPAGWDELQASGWRKENNLMAASQE